VSAQSERPRDCRRDNAEREKGLTNAVRSAPLLLPGKGAVNRIPLRLDQPGSQPLPQLVSSSQEPGSLGPRLDTLGPRRPTSRGREALSRVGRDVSWSCQFRAWRVLYDPARDITVYQSDQHRAPGHISRQGPPALRWALYEAAQIARRPGSPDREYYLQTAERVGGNRACLSVARKLLKRSYHTLRELGEEALAPA